MGFNLSAEVHAFVTITAPSRQGGINPSRRGDVRTFTLSPLQTEKHTMNEGGLAFAQTARLTA